MKKMSKTDVKSAKLLAFSLVDTDKPIEIPSYSESDSRSKGMVNWGPDNNFPNMLFQLSQNSSTLSSIINGTVELVKGEYINLNPKIHDNGDLYYYPFINKDKETIYDLVENLFRDYRMFGMFAIQVIYNKLDKVAEIVHIPAEFIRMNNDRTVIFFSKKWTKYKTNFQEYASFDRENIVDHKSQIFVYTNSGRRQVYGISPQNAALEDLASEAYAAKYVRKSLQSGLAARYLVDLPNTANLTDEQKSSIEDGIREKFTGWTNAGEFALYFNSGDKEMKITKVDIDNSHEIFEGIREAAKNNIFVVNHATPNLFGDPSSTTGFNEQEYNEAYELYNRMTLKPIKKAIKSSLDKIFNVDDSVSFEKSTPISNE